MQEDWLTFTSERAPRQARPGAHSDPRVSERLPFIVPDASAAHRDVRRDASRSLTERVGDASGRVRLARTTSTWCIGIGRTTD